VHDRHADGLERLGPGDQLAKEDVVLMQVDLGERHLRAPDLLRRRDTFAMPSITASPRWLTQRQSNEIRWRSGSLAAAVTETATASQMVTG
jgi:hypothetical protein